MSMQVSVTPRCFWQAILTLIDRTCVSIGRPQLDTVTGPRDFAA